LVRDPVARAVSQYHYRVAVEGERRSLRDALGEISDPYSVYIGPSRYATQIDLYLRHFPLERMLVVDQSDLLADRRSTLRQIFAFLSVSEVIDSSRFDEELNTMSEQRIYLPGYARLLGPVTPALVRWISPNVRRSVRRTIERTLMRTVKASTLDDDLRGRLEELYAGEVQRLRALTGKTFSTWSI